MATAEQIVSAVLEATNKRYVVEIWKSEDGKNGYTRYSDGWIEQYGIIQNLGNIIVKNVDLPIEFRSSAYHVNWSARTNAADNNQYIRQITAQTPQSFQITDLMLWQDINFYWEAKGYAA